MSFGKIKTALRGIINRKDLTDELAGDFITRAVREVERVVRIGPMEQLLEASGFDGERHTVPIPSNYLELIDMFTQDGTLRSVTKDQLFAHRNEGRPAVFCKIGASWIVKPYPAAGETVFVQFYGETLPLQTDTDENVWTRAGFNAVLYQAAALAADYFQMEDVYVQRFQGKATSLVDAILSQDLSEKWAGPLEIGDPINRGKF
jgi:hypothetical protein